MKIPFLNWIKKSSFSRCSQYFCVGKDVTLNRRKLQICDVARSDVPIEKMSLSRGLAMNKFEKDFMIYPEYTDTDDVRAIQGFTETLKKALELVADRSKLEGHGSLTNDVRTALDDCGVLSALIPTCYGGLGLGYKDQMKMFENLNIDWNIYANIAIVNSAINVLLLYGTEEMKKKYFPMIIEGKFRPIITIVDDTSINSCSHVTGTSPVNSMLFVNKKASIALSNPNVAILFATSEDRQVGINCCSCYIIDRTELKESDTWEFTRIDMVGLRAFDVGHLNLFTSISNHQMVGRLGQGIEIREELLSSTCLPLAAATIGYGKRLLRDLAAICNKTPSARKNNIMMSNENASQYATTEFALKLYVLESTSYYLAGMLDEKMPITLDIENALIHRMTRDVLLSSIATCMNLAGVRAIDLSFQFEKDIRDVTTLLSLTCNELTVEDISIAALSSWSSVCYRRTSNFLNRLLRLDQLEGQLKNPKLTHFIAEHAHPSLQMACQELEFSISRVNVVISKLLEKQGKNIKHDYTTHEQLVRVLQNHFAMLAVISRSSRSYCIGLRNGDLELAWATSICSRLSRENLSSLEMLNDHFELLRLNPSLLNVGRAIFDMGGYQLESPIERNW